MSITTAEEDPVPGLLEELCCEIAQQENVEAIAMAWLNHQATAKQTCEPYYQNQEFPEGSMQGIRRLYGCHKDSPPTQSLIKMLSFATHLQHLFHTVLFGPVDFQIRFIQKASLKFHASGIYFFGSELSMDGSGLTPRCRALFGKLMNVHERCFSKYGHNPEDISASFHFSDFNYNGVFGTLLCRRKIFVCLCVSILGLGVINHSTDASVQMVLRIIGGLSNYIIQRTNMSPSHKLTLRTIRAVRHILLEETCFYDGIIGMCEKKNYV